MSSKRRAETTELGVSDGGERFVVTGCSTLEEIKVRLGQIENCTGSLKSAKGNPLQAETQRAIIDELAAIVTDEQRNTRNTRYDFSHLTSNYQLRSEVIRLLVKQSTTESALEKILELMAPVIDAHTYTLLITAFTPPVINWDLVPDTYGLKTRLRELRGLGNR
jgi:hypothetical protein